MRKPTQPHLHALGLFREERSGSNVSAADAVVGAGEESVIHPSIEKMLSKIERTTSGNETGEFPETLIPETRREPPDHESTGTTTPRHDELLDQLALTAGPGIGATLNLHGQQPSLRAADRPQPPVLDEHFTSAAPLRRAPSQKDVASKTNEGRRGSRVSAPPQLRTAAGYLRTDEDATSASVLPPLQRTRKKPLRLPAITRPNDPDPTTRNLGPPARAQSSPELLRPTKTNAPLPSLNKPFFTIEDVDITSRVLKDRKSWDAARIQNLQKTLEKEYVQQSPGCAPADGDHSGNGGDENCIICYARKKDALLAPCGHVCVCFGCAQQICSRSDDKCPICRGYVKDVFRVYNT